MSKNVENRMEMMLLLEAKMCNPNGDPDAGNEPRRDPDGYGVITDVAFKRWIRNYIQDAYGDEVGCDIMMSRGASVNRKIAEAVFEANGIDNAKALGKGNTKVQESAAILANRYWDVRTFGGVLSTGLNAGQVKGAVQMGMAVTYDPIEVMNLTITRECYSDGKDFKTLDEYTEEERTRPDDKKRTMGEKSVVVYGLYQLQISISASEAQKVGFTEEDLNKLEEALLQMLDTNNSSSKMGLRLVTPLIIFKHVGTQVDKTSDQNKREAKLGCASAQKLYELLSVVKKDGIVTPRSTDDYEISFNMAGVPNGVEVGMKYLPFEPVKWGSDALNGWEFNSTSVM